MVVELVLRNRWTDNRVSYSVLMGFLFTFLSFGTSYVIFRGAPGFIGLSTIFLSVVLVVPTINKLFDLEEREEAKEKLSFFRRHEHIIDFFVYYFIGVFLSFFILGLIEPSFIFSEAQLHDVQAQQIAPSTASMLPPPPGSETSQVISIFKNNAYVLMVSFILSLSYGAGAMFLITLNGSIFASVLASIIRSTAPEHGFLSVYSFILCNVGVLFFHMVPEVAGYLMAAVAGGVLSHAFVREKLGSKGFYAVLLDSGILLLLSLLVIFIAAFLEVILSKAILLSDICSKSQLLIILGFVLIIVTIVVFEYLRKGKRAL